MGIFDRFKGRSGNQTEEEQQDASQPVAGQFSEQTGRGGMQTAQNTIGQQGGPQDSGMGGHQDQNQGDQSGYDPNQDQYGDQNRDQ